MQQKQMLNVEGILIENTLNWEKLSSNIFAFCIEKKMRLRFYFSRGTNMSSWQGEEEIVWKLLIQMFLTPSTTGPTPSLPESALSWAWLWEWTLISDYPRISFTFTWTTLYPTVPKNFQTLFSPREGTQKLSYQEVSNPWHFLALYRIRNLD